MEKKIKFKKLKTYFFSNIYLFYLIVFVFHFIIFFIDIVIFNVTIDFAFSLHYLLFIFACYLIRFFYFQSNELIEEIVKKKKSVENKKEQNSKSAESYLYKLRRNIFNVNRMFWTGILGGSFVTIVVIVSNVLNDYPYLLSHFLFGFYHGIGLLFIYFWLKFCHTLSKNFIKTIDIFDPDGMGGFRKLSDLFVHTTSSILLILILDFFILFSAFNNNSESFRLIVQSCFIIALIINFLALLTAYLKIRSTLLTYKIKKKDRILDFLNKIEDQFLINLSEKKDISSDVYSLLGLNILFEYCNKINLLPLKNWVICLGAATFILIFSTFFNIIVDLFIQFLKSQLF
jgi:hypothetical protein